jgi:hypothetical protein
VAVGRLSLNSLATGRVSQCWRGFNWPCSQMSLVLSPARVSLTKWGQHTQGPGMINMLLIYFAYIHHQPPHQ